MQEKVRIQYIDIVAGILILWMIIQHALFHAWAIDPNYSYSRGWNPNMWFPYLHFFMPWFFYKSGAFFHKRSMKDLWIKDYHKFIRIFIIWSFAGYILYIILGLCDHTMTWHDAIYAPTIGFFYNGFIPKNDPLWFIFTLVGVRFIANIVLPQKEDNHYHIRCLLIVLIATAVAYMANQYRTHLPLWIGNGAAGLAYFTLGYWLTKYEQNNWFAISCIIGYIVGCIFYRNTVNMLLNLVMEGHYLLWFPASLFGIVAFNVAVRKVCELHSQYAPPHIRAIIIERIGLCAMPIYITHSFVRYPVHTFLVTTNHLLKWEYTFVIICVGYALILPLVCVIWSKLYK